MCFTTFATVFVVAARNAVDVASGKRKQLVVRKTGLSWQF